MSLNNGLSRHDIQHAPGYERPRYPAGGANGRATGSSIKNNAQPAMGHVHAISDYQAVRNPRPHRAPGSSQGHRSRRNAMIQLDLIVAAILFCLIAFTFVRASLIAVDSQSEPEKTMFFPAPEQDLAPIWNGAVRR